VLCSAIFKKNHQNIINLCYIISGGFLAFQAMYPSLCESKTNNYRCAALTSLSQPCLPVSNVGPTRILPFLYLGSQQDALSEDIVKVWSPIVMKIIDIAKVWSPSFQLYRRYGLLRKIIDFVKVWSLCNQSIDIVMVWFSCYQNYRRYSQSLCNENYRYCNGMVSI
jgi:hypothetical protein